MKRRKKVIKKPRIRFLNYDFDQEGHYPTYKDVESLEKFLTERGKIIPRTRTGVSAKGQRHITCAIKRARQLALLPFVVQV